MGRSLVIGPVLLATGLITGCGEGDRMESGTQVQVTDDLLQEAKAQDEYFESQKKSAKSGAKKPVAEKEGPGAPP